MIYEAKEFALKDGTRVTLKTPEPSEAAEVLELMRRITGQTDFLLSAPEDYAAMTAEQEARFIENNRAGNAYFICAYADGRIIGDCSLAFNRHVKDKHRCSIGIGIDAAFCDRGLGSLIFDELIRLAGEQGGIDQIELGVISHNARAKHLYEKKGFVQTGLVPRALKLPDGTYRDEILMTKFLTPDPRFAE